MINFDIFLAKNLNLVQKSSDFWVCGSVETVETIANFNFEKLFRQKYS